MNHMNVINSLKHPSMLLAGVWARLGKNVSDQTYLKLRYRLVFGKKLNLENPKGFNEKINWLKVYNRNPLYTKIVDKATAKDYVRPIIGDDKIIPSYGVWDKFDDIDFNILPDQFVLKSTNGGGGSGVVICKDKKTFDKEKAKQQLERSMRVNWKFEREWVYRDITPRIIAEKYMFNEDGSDLVDWKIFCFNGVPKLLFYASDRYTKGEPLKFDWYDMELNHLPIKSHGIPQANKELKMFPEWEEMKETARQLSQGFPHIRVDLYLINHKVYFGELTFFHDGGIVALEPEEWEYKLGGWIDLPEKIQE